MGKTFAKAPALFIGHGSPMNAIGHNDFTRSLNGLRALYPEPRAILVVSAHWLTRGTFLTAMSAPRTIHDFGGFPAELFAVQYRAPGSPEVASEIQSLLTSSRIQLDTSEWGLDHGTWAVLRHVFPDANVPVLQLSIDFTQPPEFHLELGRQLELLRSRGVLVVGSGNLAHNLRRISPELKAPVMDWAAEFDLWTKQKLEMRDEKALLHDFQSTLAGQLAVPTPDHYYPMLYALGAGGRDTLRFTHEEIQNGSISMRSFAMIG